MTPAELRRLFRTLVMEAQGRDANLSARLIVGKASEFPKVRDYAYCVNEVPAVVVVAPKILDGSKHRAVGVLMHELGHALWFLRGEPQHSETEADDLARRIFAAQIGYDNDDVQTTDPAFARRLRPRYLPNPGCCR